MKTCESVRCRCCAAQLPPSEDATRWEGFREEVERYGSSLLRGPLCEVCLQETLDTFSSEQYPGDYSDDIEGD